MDSETSPQSTNPLRRPIDPTTAHAGQLWFRPEAGFLGNLVDFISVNQQATTMSRHSNEGSSFGLMVAYREMAILRVNGWVLLKDPKGGPWGVVPRSFDLKTTLTCVPNIFTNFDLSLTLQTP